MNAPRSAPRPPRRAAPARPLYVVHEPGLYHAVTGLLAGRRSARPAMQRGHGRRN